jgi:hypothetical protein
MKWIAILFCFGSFFVGLNGCSLDQKKSNEKLTVPNLSAAVASDFYLTESEEDLDGKNEPNEKMKCDNVGCVDGFIKAGDGNFFKCSKCKGSGWIN